MTITNWTARTVLDLANTTQRAMAGKDVFSVSGPHAGCFDLRRVLKLSAEAPIFDELELIGRGLDVFEVARFLNNAEAIAEVTA